MNEEFLDCRQAAAIAPGKPSANSVWRWAARGFRVKSGETIRLRHVRMGSRILTTQQWLLDFGTEVAAKQSPPTIIAAAPSARNLTSDRLDKILGPSR